MRKPAINELIATDEEVSVGVAPKEINNTLSTEKEIFSDDELCKNRLITEIKLHQQKIKDGKNDYSKIF